MSEIKGPSRRGRPLGRWKDRLKEYMSEGGANRGRGFEQTKRECLDRKRWRPFYCGHPLGGYSQME